MIITLILILLALAALVFFVLRGFGPSRPVTDQAELNGNIRAVDLEAFRNLIDPEEEEFLRGNLPAGEFRAIQRQRLRAAIDYLAAVSHNAALLLHLGLSARRSADPRIAETAQNLVDNALRLRLYSALAICKLCVRVAFPSAVLQPAGVAELYQVMTEWAAQLGRLQYSNNGALISRTL
jgi:hypothetical protein